MHEHIQSTSLCLGAVLDNMCQLVSDQAFGHANKNDLDSARDQCVGSQLELLATIWPHCPQQQQ